MVAVTADKVIVELEARVAQYNRNVSNAVKRFDDGMKRVERAASRAEQGVNASFARLGSRLRTSVAAIVGGLGVNEVRRYGDTWTEAGNKIAAASQISGIQAESLSVLTDRAIKARTAFEPYIDLYSRLLRTGGQVGATQEQIALATDIVSKSFKAGGAAAQEQAAGILQLGQALGSGFLQGDELRSLRENAPLIAAAIADEFETTIGGLKELGAEGELTSDRVFSAILKGRGQIEAAFAKTNSTIGDGFQNLRSALIRFVGDADDAVGATETLVAALNALANNLNIVAAALLAITGRAVAPLIAALAVGLANAARVAATALGLLAVSGGGAVVAMSALRTAIGLLGGPVGAALVGVSAIAAAFIGLRDDTATLPDTLAKVSQGLTAFGAKARELGNVEQALESDTARLEKANDALNEAVKTGGDVAEATARADVAAIQKRIAANENLKGAILATIEAQKLALQADAALARSQFTQQFGGSGFQRSPQGEGLGKTAGGFGVASADNSEEARLSRQTAAIEKFRASAEKALAVGDITDAQAEFFNLESTILSNEAAVSELDSALNKIRQGVSTSVAGGGGGGGGGSGSKTKLNEFEREIASISERSAALSIQIGLQNQINPLVRDYEAQIEAAAVKSDLLTAAQAAGIEVTAELRQQIDDLANAFGTVAIQADFSSAFANNVAALNQEIFALQAQTDALSTVNPLMNDYGASVAAATVEAELLLQAQQAGIEITDTLRDSIRLLAEEYGGAIAASNELADVQDNLVDAVDRFQSTATGAVKSFISDILDGKNALESLSGILLKISDQLLNLAIDNLGALASGSAPGSVSTGGGIFGLIGTLFTSFAAKGGVFAAGRELPRFGRGGVSDRAAIFAEAGPEAAVPLPDGRSIPVKFNGLPDLMPKRSAATSNDNSTINLGGITLEGVKDADTFMETMPQMFARVGREIDAVKDRRTA